MTDQIDGTPPPRRAVFLDPTTPPLLGTLILLTGVAAMSMNLFLTSLPQMARDFGTSYGVIQLTVGIYLGITALMQVLLGPLADRWGRRRVMLAAYVIYTLASAACALAPTVTQFLVARGFQAVVFAGIVLARAIVRDSRSENDAAAMLGYVTLGMAVVPMVSPAIGGWLDHSLGWRSGFWLMSGFGALAVALIWRDVGETRTATFTSFADQFRAYPTLLRSRLFWAYVLAMSSAGGTFYAYLGGAPYVGAQVFQIAPTQLGLLLGASSLGYASGSFASGRLSRKLGVRRMIFIGTSLTSAALASALAIFALGFGSPAIFFGGMLVMAVGYGITLPNATSGALSVAPTLTATASGLSGGVVVGLGAILSALTGAVMAHGAGAERLLAIQLCIALVGLVVAARLRNAPPTRP